MATNKYFNNYNFANTQNLVDGLIIEAIQIYGIDCYYIPRHVVSENPLFQDPQQTRFEQAIPMEMYVRDVRGFTGDGKFLSKFGLEIRDEMTFTIAKTTFNNLVGGVINIPRPNEGDLVWFPMDQKLYSISFVDHQNIFYQMGKLQTYDLTCMLYEYSNEKFQTGITEIDTKYAQYDLSDGTNNVDPQDQADVFQEEATDVIDFTPDNPFGDKIY